MEKNISSSEKKTEDRNPESSGKISRRDFLRKAALGILAITSITAIPDIVSGAPSCCYCYKDCYQNHFGCASCYYDNYACYYCYNDTCHCDCYANTNSACYSKGRDCRCYVNCYCCYDNCY